MMAAGHLLSVSGRLQSSPQGQAVSFDIDIHIFVSSFLFQWYSVTLIFTDFINYNTIIVPTLHRLLFMLCFLFPFLPVPLQDKCMDYPHEGVPYIPVLYIFHP